VFWAGNLALKKGLLAEKKKVTLEERGGFLRLLHFLRILCEGGTNSAEGKSSGTKDYGAKRAGGEGNCRGGGLTFFSASISCFGGVRRYRCWEAGGSKKKSHRAKEGMQMWLGCVGGGGGGGGVGGGGVFLEHSPTPLLPGLRSSV